MSNEDKILTLCPEIQDKCRLFIMKADKWLASQPFWKIYTVIVTQARRSIYLQAGLYSQGRHWQKNSQMWVETSPHEIVTHTLESKHITGEAFDIALQRSDGTVDWPRADNVTHKEMWLELAEIAKSIDLIPGALWEKPDWDHFEID